MRSTVGKALGAPAWRRLAPRDQRHLHEFPVSLVGLGYTLPAVGASAVAGPGILVSSPGLRDLHSISGLTGPLIWVSNTGG